MGQAAVGTGAVIAVWGWLTKFAAPLIGAFLAGVFWQQARDARADRQAVEAAMQEAAAEIAEAGASTVEAIEAARISEEERQVDYERLQAVIRRNIAPVGDCIADADDGERVRLKTGAANGYALGGVSRGAGEDPRGD